MASISSGNPLGDFQVPDLDADADIQVAFRTYHYGDQNYSGGDPSADSVAGYLLNLAAGSTSPADLSTEDLDDLTDSGFYHQDTSGSATLANHYPVEGLEGLLRVTTSGTNVYQQYHTLTTNQFFVRTKNAVDGWFDWKEAGSADFVGNLMLGGM